MNNKIKAFVFDMDGVLFDSEKIVQCSWNIVGEELGWGNVGEHIYNTVGMNVIRRKQYFLENVSVNFPFEMFNIRSHEVFRKIVDCEGIEMKPGAKELILNAKEEGYKLAVATSSSRIYATKLLNESGIYDLLDDIVYGDMVKYSKPNPEIYLKACERIDVAPEECIAFEDAPVGVCSASAAGLRVVFVPDLVHLSEEIKKLVWKQVESLEECVEYIKT